MLFYLCVCDVGGVQALYHGIYKVRGQLLGVGSFPPTLLRLGLCTVLHALVLPAPCSPHSVAYHVPASRLAVGVIDYRQTPLCPLSEDITARPSLQAQALASDTQSFRVARLGLQP